MIEYDPFGDRVIDDPFPVYRQLRDEAPLHYIEEHDCWFLSRFGDIWKALEVQEGTREPKACAISIADFANQFPTATASIRREISSMS